MERTPNPEERKEIAVSLMKQAIPLETVWQRVPDDFLADNDNRPINDRITPEDLPVIAHALDSSGIDSVAWASELKKRYEAAGHPKTVAEFERVTTKPAAEAWSRLFFDTLHLVTTYQYREAIHGGKAIEDMPHVQLSGELSESERATPIAQRNGLQNNILIRVSHYDDKNVFEPELKAIASEAHALRSSDPQTYLDKKFAVEAAYIQHELTETST